MIYEINSSTLKSIKTEDQKNHTDSETGTLSSAAPAINSDSRFLVGIFYFFTLILLSSYTANLAASLTAENLNTPISEVEDLTLAESRE